MNKNWRNKSINKLIVYCGNHEEGNKLGDVGTMEWDGQERSS